MSTNISMETENGGQLSEDFLKENLQTLWVDGIIVLDAEGKTDCEYSTDESLANEITEYLQKDIIMDFAGYEERSYSERFTREDGSHIDIAACARKDAPGIVAIYYYTSPEFARNYTLTIQGLLNGYSTQKDGTILVADEGIVVASNDESLLGQNTTGSGVIQEMKKLVQDFCPRGALTVQLIRDERTGNDQYIEINPRFGGGAPLSMKAGADSAMALLQILCGKTVNYQENAARNNAVYSRFDQSVCIRERTDWKIGQSGFSAVIFDLDDTLYSEKAYIRSGFRAIARVLPFVEKVEERLWNYFEAGLPAIDALLHDLHIEDTATRSECLKAYRTHQPQIQLYPEVPKFESAFPETSTAAS